jgi:hypothetical protein
LVHACIYIVPGWRTETTIDDGVGERGWIRIWLKVKADVYMHGEWLGLRFVSLPAPSTVSVSRGMGETKHAYYYIVLI